eukprot:Seg3334.2 transcript_id=Seg3334.2/GoldUCD/mRNA.D3Y31 product="hypothetical protein" protein_id=Seg3334.2/GoldUCD/D3Y31
MQVITTQTETDIERESPPPDHTEDPTIFTTDGPTALAETIRREKAKAGVERARSYEETGEIYEICSRDRWSSNNNEPPEELDSATAREHEEPYQATNGGKSDGRGNRRSSGYGSGSNRESDGPWNYPIDSRDAIYGAEEPIMKSPMHKNNLFHFNSDFTGPRFAQRKAQSMSNLLDIQQDAFSPERCHMSPIEQNSSIVEKLEIIISTRRRSSEPDDSNSKQRVAQQPQNTCVHCQQPRSGSDPNGMRPAKDKERKPTRPVSESAMQGLINRNDCQHQCYADVFPTPQPPNRLLGNTSEPSTQCDVRPRQSSNRKDKGSKQFRTRSRSTEERFRGPSENFDTSATIRPPSFCLNTRFFNITRQFSDIEEVGDGSRVGQEASSISQQPRSVSDATEKRPKQLTTACKSLSLD